MSVLHVLALPLPQPDAHRAAARRAAARRLLLVALSPLRRHGAVVSALAISAPPLRALRHRVWLRTLCARRCRGL